MEGTKEKEVTVSSKSSKQLAGGKTVYKLETDEGARLDCWDKTLYDVIAEGVAVKLRWTEKKNGEYTNRTVVGVSVLQESGEFGPWLEQVKRAGSGPKQFDSDGANRRACLQAAATIVGAAIAKAASAGSVSVHTATTLKVAEEFMSGFFKKAAPAAAPKAKVEAAHEPEPQEEEVPF